MKARRPSFSASTRDLAPATASVRCWRNWRPICSTSKYGLPELEKYLTYGASPRATIGLIEGAKALALLRGRSYALPEDMVDLVPDVLRHRLVPSYEALAEGLNADDLVQRVLKKTPVPDKPLAHPQAATA